MKTLYIIIASFCCIIGYSQEKNSTRKDFVSKENIEALKARVKKDSLSGIKGVNTKKNQVIQNNNNNNFQNTVDTLSQSTNTKKASSKKK